MLEQNFDRICIRTFKREKGVTTSIKKKKTGFIWNGVKRFLLVKRIKGSLPIEQVSQSIDRQKPDCKGREIDKPKMEDVG